MTRASQHKRRSRGTRKNAWQPPRTSFVYVCRFRVTTMGVSRLCEKKLSYGGFRRHVQRQHLLPDNLGEWSPSMYQTHASSEAICCARGGDVHSEEEEEDEEEEEEDENESDDEKMEEEENDDEKKTEEENDDEKKTEEENDDEKKTEEECDEEKTEEECDEEKKTDEECEEEEEETEMEKQQEEDQEASMEEEKRQQENNEVDERPDVDEESAAAMLSPIAITRHVVAFVSRAMRGAQHDVVAHEPQLDSAASVASSEHH